jgi:hypothetical protein
MPEFKDLDGVMEFVERKARWAVSQGQGMAPWAFMATPKGVNLLAFEEESTEAAKLRFAERVRLVCVAKDAAAAVLIGSAWMARGTQNEKTILPPSQNPNRQECLLLIGRSFGKAIQKLIPVERDAKEKITGFGAPETYENIRPMGALANFFPDSLPDAAARRQAQEQLDAEPKSEQATEILFG